MAKKSKKSARRKRIARIRRCIFGMIILALAAWIAWMLIQDPQLADSMNPFDSATATPEATATLAPTETPASTQEISVTPTPTETPVPTPEPEPDGVQEIDVASLSEDVLPSRDAVQMNYKIYQDGKEVESYTRKTPIDISSADNYTDLEGVTTFRGNNWRTTGSYGVVPNDSSSMSIKYSFDISGLDSWTGVGWTGQPAIVCWPEETRKNMNLYEDKKAKDGLVEVIYATLDGHIYFFDLEDGEFTRDAINIGAPIKGSVSVDPRGYPLLYCGQGIDEVNGKSVKIGMRIFSLIDGSELLFIDGRDDLATRHWYASDCAPIVDASSDTLIWPGENGLVYTVTLNSQYDAEAGVVSIDPVIDRFWYESKVTTRPGMENSVVVYNHYAYFADNSGLVTCLDLNTMTPVWCFDALDDTDASLVLDETDDGVYLYTGSELDLSSSTGEGDIYLRCLNALTGEEVWNMAVPISDSSDTGGVYATPALGSGSVDHLVFFTVSRAVDEKGERLNVLYALDKKTGEIVWQLSTGGFAWSSPTLTFDSNGRAYLFQNNSNGDLKMIDAETGKKIDNIDLGSNVEGSPAIYGDMLVIGTRGRKIYGVKIN